MILNASTNPDHKSPSKHRSHLFDKIVVFSLTFSAYAGLHAVRVGWSYSNPQMEEQNQPGINPKFFSFVDTLYLIFYSIGMATIGNFNKKIPLNWFIAGGMILSCLFYMSIALFHMLFGSSSQAYILIAMCLNGFFQSAGWPSIIAVMGNWFGKNKKGLLMGIWAINSNIGNILGQVMCNIFEENEHISWQYNFYGTGILTIIIALFVLFFLKPQPQIQTKLVEEEIEMEDGPTSDISLQKISQNKQNNSNGSSSSISEQTTVTQQKNKKQNMTIFSAFKLPRVPHYVIGYACLKGCIYGLLFWLPSYLQDQFEQQKGYMASMVDLGSFIGGLAVGYLGDKYTYRSLFLSPFLFVSASIMFIVSFMLTNVAWTYYLALFGIGVCLGGPYNIIRSAITIDLGLQSKSQNILAVAALIEGCASFLAAISQMLIPLMPQSAIFYLFCSECTLAGVTLLPLLAKDIKKITKKTIQ